MWIQHNPWYLEWKSENGAVYCIVNDIKSYEFNSLNLASKSGSSHLKAILLAEINYDAINSFQSPKYQPSCFSLPAFQLVKYNYKLHILYTVIKSREPNHATEPNCLVLGNFRLIFVFSHWYLYLHGLFTWVVLGWLLLHCFSGLDQKSSVDVRDRRNATYYLIGFSSVNCRVEVTCSVITELSGPVLKGRLPNARAPRFCRWVPAV